MRNILEFVFLIAAAAILFIFPESTITLWVSGTCLGIAWILMFIDLWHDIKKDNMEKSFLVLWEE